MENKPMTNISSSSIKNLKSNILEASLFKDNKILVKDCFKKKIQRNSTPHNLLRFKYEVIPDHLINKKDRWTEVKNIGEIIELKGSEKRKFHTSNSFREINLFNNKQLKNEEILKRGLKKSEQKLLENSKSLRTLRPETDNFTSFIYTPKKKVYYDSRLKSSANGSIYNLILTTPINKKLFDKKKSHKDSQSFIFNTDCNSFRREKSTVDFNQFEREKCSFAGLNSKEIHTRSIIQSSSPLNYSRSKKLLSLSSDIFFSNQAKNNEFSKITPADTKCRGLNKQKNSVSFTVELVDNTKKLYNLESRTRNERIKSNFSTKINTNLITNTETFYKTQKISA